MKLSEHKIAKKWCVQTIKKWSLSNSFLTKSLIRVCTIRQEQPRQAKIVLTVFFECGNFSFELKSPDWTLRQSREPFLTLLYSCGNNRQQHPPFCTLTHALTHTHLHTHTHTRTHTHAFTHTPSPSSSCTLLSAWISKRAEKLSSFSFQHEI